MKKIISLFRRDYEGTRLVFDEVVEGAEWVATRAGVATEKFDGTCCMVRGGNLFKRYRLKEGNPKPEGWLHHDFDPDAPSGHGWLPVDGSTSDRWHKEAWTLAPGYMMEDGTYELVGPKVQRNPYRLETHEFRRHGSVSFPAMPVRFGAIEEFLAGTIIEGIVWRHPDGRMAKIKRKDFGFEWPVKS